MNEPSRRGFLQQLTGIGLFMILPGAGRIWVPRRDVLYNCILFGAGQDYVKAMARLQGVPRPPLRIAEIEVDQGGLGILSFRGTMADFMRMRRITQLEGCRMDGNNMTWLLPHPLQHYVG